MTGIEFAEEIKKIIEETEGRLEVITSRECRNGEKETYIRIREKPDSYAVPVQVDGYMERYLNGEDLTRLSREITVLYMLMGSMDQKTAEEILDFEKIKDRICLKLISGDDKQLEYKPHKMLYYDLAAVYYIFLDKIELTCYDIGNILYGMYYTDIDMLHSIAMRNTQRLFPGDVLTIESIFVPELKWGDNFLVKEHYKISKENSCMYICTNDIKTYGAAVMLYDSLLEDFAETIGSDFYILPSSRHEVIFVPFCKEYCKEYVTEELQEIVRYVNGEIVHKEDYLSDSVYFYSQAEGIKKY